MKKPRIYLDTSVLNFLFADDTPNFKQVTQEFFEKHASAYDARISEVVLLEIEHTPDRGKRERLLSVVKQYQLKVLPATNADEALSLVNCYLEHGAIPKDRIEDARHVAHATVSEVDVFVSWNFRHLANINREAKVRAINIEQGYWRPLRMVMPLGVCCG